MRATELIKALTNEVIEHGDADVKIEASDYNEDVSNVTFIPGEEPSFLKQPVPGYIIIRWAGGE